MASEAIITEELICKAAEQLAAGDTPDERDGARTAGEVDEHEGRQLRHHRPGAARLEGPPQGCRVGRAGTRGRAPGCARQGAGAGLRTCGAWP